MKANEMAKEEDEESDFTKKSKLKHSSNEDSLT